MINLKEEFDPEDYQSDQIEIELSSTKIDFPFIQFYKYSEKIQREYENEQIKENIKQQIIEIQHNLNINDKSIKVFIDLLKDSDVEINNECYIDLIKLSNIFEIHPLAKCLDKYAQLHSKDIDFIIQIILSIQETKIEFLTQKEINKYEQILSEEINQCFNNDKFNILPVSSIYRIIKKSDTKKIDQKLLYNFIMNKIEERCVLFSFVSVNLMDDETFNQMYSKFEEKNIYYEYLPHNLIYIKELRDTKQKLELCIQKLQLSNETFETQTVELTSKNDNLMAKLINNEKRINEQELINVQLKNKFTDVVDENKQIKIKNQEQERKLNELNEQLQLLKNENEKIKAGKYFPPRQDDVFSGIINFLKNKQNGHIENEIEITASSICNNDVQSYNPYYSVLYENKNKFFYSVSTPNSWL